MKRILLLMTCLSALLCTSCQQKDTEIRDAIQGMMEQHPETYTSLFIRIVSARDTSSPVANPLKPTSGRSLNHVGSSRILSPLSPQAAKGAMCAWHWTL